MALNLLGFIFNKRKFIVHVDSGRSKLALYLQLVLFHFYLQLGVRLGLSLRFVTESLLLRPVDRVDLPHFVAHRIDRLHECILLLFCSDQGLHLLILIYLLLK